MRSLSNGAITSSRISIPAKQYFFKADVEEFKKEAKTLDDQIREGNIEFARKVLDRFLIRQDERFKTQMELLKTEARLYRR